MEVGTDIGNDGACAGRRPPRSAGEIAAALVDAREYTLAAYAHLDAAQERFPRLREVNPPRWEIGHIGWFQEFWCRRYRPDDPTGARTPPRLPEADRWWDSRHVPHDVRWDLPLPDWDRVHAYLAATLEDALARLPDVPDRTFHELALYHEDMHGEALLMTLQTLALPAPPWWRSPAVAPAAVPAVDVTLDGGPAMIGAAPAEARSRFVFDNEQWSHEVRLAPFAIASRPVTQGEFAAFVDDGGYLRDALWPADARAWRARVGRTMPAYWRRDAGGFEIRRFDAWQPIDPNAPMCHVCAYEAEAWCAWAGRRLPTEAEWERAALAGVVAVPGDVWEWTATAFGPYPGFTPGPYAEYSAPWFGDHRVMRGGAWATRARLVHPRFRNFYTPDRHDVFVGFRTCAAGCPWDAAMQQS